MIAAIAFPTLSPAIIGGIPGWAEMAVILLIILLLFGNKLPNIARNLGKSMIEFKRGIKATDDEEPEQIEGSSTARIESQSREATGAGAKDGGEVRDS